MHYLTSWGQSAVQLVYCTASLPWGSGRCNSCNARPHRRGTLGSRSPAMRGPTSFGDLESCPGGSHYVISQTLAMRCLSASGQWAVELLQCTPTPPAGRGQCNSYLGAVGRGRSYNALPPSLGAVGSATPPMHCFNAYWQWAVELLSCTATLPRSSGHWNSCNALRHCLEPVGSAAADMPGPTNKESSESCPRRARYLKSGNAAKPSHPAWG